MVLFSFSFISKEQLSFLVKQKLLTALLFKQFKETLNIFIGNSEETTRRNKQKNWQETDFNEARN